MPAAEAVGQTLAMFAIGDEQSYLPAALLAPETAEEAPEEAALAPEEAPATSRGVNILSFKKVATAIDSHATGSGA